MNHPVTAKSAKHSPQVSTVEEHARLRFESIRREARLAPELTCFQSGQPLSRIRFVANANSIHVAQWLKLLSYTEAFVEVETADPSQSFSGECFSSHPLLPRWLKLPMVVRYLLSGLRLRFLLKQPQEELLHAHSASGNGMAAWLSGQRYVIGAYGSEIFGSDKRSFAYRWLLKQIVGNAIRIQASSAECARILHEQYGVSPEKIYCFHLGLDETIFHPVDEVTRLRFRREAGLPINEPIWIANRRVHPHYRTQEVVEGFLAYRQHGGTGRLVLLCGENDLEYTAKISDLVKAHREGTHVIIVDRMLSQQEVARWLQLSDYAISVPKTDMLSVSTYQALGCGAVDILSNLESYNPLRDCEPIVWMNEFAPRDFEMVFQSTGQSWSTQYPVQRQQCLQFTKDRFSSENAIRDIAAFYLGTPVRQDGLAKWAA